MGVKPTFINQKKIFLNNRFNLFLTKFFSLGKINSIIRNNKIPKKTIELFKNIE
jgi:hypothetical protein